LDFNLGSNQYEHKGNIYTCISKERKCTIISLNHDGIQYRLTQQNNKMKTKNKK
jgi:hypothetical protein